MARLVAAEVERLLGQIGLPAEFADRLPTALSGGQKQRVCLARALAAKPDLIICDEVTSALDPLVAEEMLRLLRALQDELKSRYLFITHDLGVVRRLADRTMSCSSARWWKLDRRQRFFEPPFKALYGPPRRPPSPNCGRTGSTN